MPTEYNILRKLNNALTTKRFIFIMLCVILFIFSSKFAECKQDVLLGPTINSNQFDRHCVRALLYRLYKFYAIYQKYPTCWNQLDSISEYHKYLFTIYSDGNILYPFSKSCRFNYIYKISNSKDRFSIEVLDRENHSTYYIIDEKTNLLAGFPLMPIVLKRHFDSETEEVKVLNGLLIQYKQLKTELIRSLGKSSVPKTEHDLSLISSLHKLITQIAEIENDISVSYLEKIFFDKDFGEIPPSSFRAQIFFHIPFLYIDDSQKLALLQQITRKFRTKFNTEAISDDLLFKTIENVNSLEAFKMLYDISNQNVHPGSISAKRLLSTPPGLFFAAKLGDRDAYETTLAIAGNKKESCLSMTNDLATRCQAINILGEIGNRRALPLLTNLLNDEIHLIKSRSKESIIKIFRSN